MSSADEEVEDWADRLYEEREEPQELRAAHLPGRAARQVPESDRRHDQLGDRAEHDGGLLSRREVRPSLLLPLRLAVRRRIRRVAFHRDTLPDRLAVMRVPIGRYGVLLLHLWVLTGAVRECTPPDS